MPPETELLTVAEAAEYLRVSQATIWRWCQAQKIPAFKIGHEWRILGPALRKMLITDTATPVAAQTAPTETNSSAP